MKSTKQVLAEYPNYSPLIRAVLKGLNDKSQIEEINRYGIENGYGSFIYYSDTHKFAMKNRKQIIKLLNKEFEDIGYKSVFEMVSSFGVFRHGIDQEDETDIYQYLGMGKPEQGTVTNVMCWYAVETVCRWFED